MIVAEHWIAFSSTGPQSFMWLVQWAGKGLTLARWLLDEVDEQRAFEHFQVSCLPLSIIILATLKMLNSHTCYRC